MIDRRGHHPELVRHPDRGDHAVEREHDIENHDLRDDAAETRGGLCGADMFGAQPSSRSWISRVPL